jgi:hypothetical protein
MQQLADGRATAQVTAPVVVALGKQRKQRIRRLVRGKGRLMDEVQDVIEQVRSSFHDGAEGKIFVPIVLVYRRKTRRAGLWR